MEKRYSINTGNVAVEIPLPDGWMSLFIGELVSRTSETITLKDVAWIKDTGRRNEFFAGEFDGNCEAETYPDGVLIELPAAGAVVTQWPNPLIRKTI